jgi:hypothetical protein
MKVAAWLSMPWHDPGGMLISHIYFGISSCENNSTPDLVKDVAIHVLGSLNVPLWSARLQNGMVRFRVGHHAMLVSI